MTYGYWLDQVHAHLVDARWMIGRADAADIVDATTVVAHRDACVGQLNRLVLLVAGVGSRGGVPVAARPNAVAVRASKDPMVNALLRAMPTALGTVHSGDAMPRSAVASALGAAAQAGSVAGDILASHVDPINGPRTPEGAAIRLGAGRPAALTDVARLAVDLVHVDEAVLSWVQRATRPQLRPGSVLYRMLVTELAGDGLGQLAAVATLSPGPGLVRQLGVASVLAMPDRPRTPDTAAQCADLIDDFRLWAFRYPEQVGGLHLSAATRVGLLIAATAAELSGAEQQGWRAAVHALGDIAARTPHHRDLRFAELGHVADLLRTDPGALDEDELASLAGRLPLLAGTLDVVTRRLVRQGALLAKVVALDPSARTAGIAKATGRWSTAALRSRAVTALLTSLEHAAAQSSDQLSRSPAGRAFPQLNAVTLQPRSAQEETQPAATVRSRRR